MKSTRTRFVAKVLMLLFCLTLHYVPLEGKAIKKHKHAIHANQKSGSKKHEAPRVCMDNSYCSRYSHLDCASEWVDLNCPKMCRRCEDEGPDIMKLPAVIYYREGQKKNKINTHKKSRSKDVKKSTKKHEYRKRDVVFLKKTTYNNPTSMPPTTSYNLFDYKSNYGNWYFTYPDQYPVYSYYDNRAAASDSTQQYAQQQQKQQLSTQVQSGATNAAPAAAPAAAPVAAAVPPATRVNAVAPIAAPGSASIASVPAVTSPAAGSAAAVQSTNQAATKVPTADVQQPIAQQSYAVQNQTTGAQQLQLTAVQPENQTIELINETVTVVNETEIPVVETGIQPAVASVAKPNQTMTGASPPVAAPVSATTAATNQTTTTPAAAVVPIQGQPTSGSNTSQYQPQPLEEVHPQNQSLVNDVNTSYNLSLPLEEFNPQNVSLVNDNNTSQNSLQPQAELQHVSQADWADQLKPLQSQAQQQQLQSLKQPPPSNTPSTINITQEIFNSAESGSSSKSVDESSEPVAPVHKLHVTSTGQPNEVFGNFNPNSVAITLSGPGSIDLTSTGKNVTHNVMVNPQSLAQNTEQSANCCNDVEESKECIPCPKMPKAPPLTYVFNIYCDDLYKDCAYGYSNCNDTWWQMNCPKRCNLCKAKDNVKHTPAATKTKEIYPNKVADLPEMNVLESDLVAPAPGKKPIVAKYTLRVKPKLVNGVAQTQEIRIMPANHHGNVKPLMVLKQNITKPMIENIEIDVPKKGMKYSSKPSVEVIEGSHKEMLKVNKGLAVVEDAVQKSKTKQKEYRTEKPQETTNKDSTEPTQSPATPAPVASREPSDELNTPPQSSAQPATAAAVSPPPAVQTAAYTGAQTCKNDERCNLFPDDRCSEEWLQTNCRSMCKLC